MAVKFTVIECPECGSNLHAEEGRKKLFCSYCGKEIIMTDENEYTYRHVNEADVIRAETEQLICLRELEIEEKENEHRRKGRCIAYIIAVGLAIIGVQNILLGFIAVPAAMAIAMIAYTSKYDKKKKVRRVVSRDDIEITKNLCRCEGEDFNVVVAQYEAAGFINIKAVPLHDLSILATRKSGQVKSVSINKDDDFDVGDVFKKSDRVVVLYHSVK